MLLWPSLRLELGRLSTTFTRPKLKGLPRPSSVCTAVYEDVIESEYFDETVRKAFGDVLESGSTVDKVADIACC